MKKILCLLLTAALVSGVSGCGNGNAGADGAKAGQEEEGREGVDISGENGLGRYAEKETDLTDELEVVSSLKKFSDGRFMITDRFYGLWESGDQGASWTKVSHPWLDKMSEETYLLDLQAAEDGTLAVIWNESDEEEEESPFAFDPVAALIRPDGTQIPVEPDLEEEEGYPWRFWISDTGRIFISTLGDKLYEVKEDGSSELFLTMDGRPELVQFQGDLLIADGYDFKEPVLYDMEKKEYVKDEGLSAFISENYPERSFNGGSWYDLYIFPGEEGVLYFAGRKGLHRLVIGEGVSGEAAADEAPGQQPGGGSAAEKLIEGSLSYLGNNRYSLKGMIMSGHTQDQQGEYEEFLSVSSEGKLVKYTWDPEMTSVPEERLTIYSLEESWGIRTAVSTYQLSHPQVYVEYEVGMEAESGITREDALKKLNTQIMAGEGPDLLMLDDLPLDSYMEKGLLLDLSGFLEQLCTRESLYENLFRSLSREQKVYAVPGEVYLPVIFGREKYVSGVEDLSSMAERIEQLRRDCPEKELLDVYSAKGVMKAFAPVCAPAWKTQDGGIDREAVAEYLTQMKRIYEAQTKRAGEDITDKYQQESENNTELWGENWEYDILLYGEEYLYYVAGDLQLSAGVTTSPYGYFGINSIERVKGFEDVKAVPMEGMCSNVYVPAFMLGINAASKQPELAEDFLGAFLGEEIQCALGGYSINKNAFEKNLRPDEEYVGEDGQYSTVAISDGEGLEVSMDIYVATEEQKDVLRGWMASADTPYIADFVLEKTVFEEGEKFFRGEQSLEESLDRIMQQLGIYMSE